MAASDPILRSDLARRAQLIRWSKERDRTAATQPARDARLAQFDPGPEIPEPQRSKMIQAGVEADMIRVRLARRSAAQRRRDKLAVIADALAAEEESAGAEAL